MNSNVKDILLAEDDPTSALLLKRELESAGHAVTVVGNGRLALEAVRARRFDLLITDVMMPEMDGVDLYLELKANPETALLPVIIVTDKQMFRESFAMLGVDHFVDKAANIDVLMEKIAKISELGTEQRYYRKILIGGGVPRGVDEMGRLLQARECLVAVASAKDVVSKALEMKPHVILIDLLFEADFMPKELVRSLRCYACLKETKIVTYDRAYLNEEEIEKATLEYLEDQIVSCLLVGATKHLGHFNPDVIVDGLKEFGVVGSGKDALVRS